MKSFLHFLGSLALISLFPALQAQVPAKLELPPSLSAAGTVATVNGQAWGYVVWQATDAAWLAPRDIIVSLKPTAPDVAGTFTEQGTVGPVADEVTLKILANRASALGDNLTECADIAQMLLQNWASATGMTVTVPASLEARTAMVMKRAKEGESYMSSVRQLGHAHVFFRLASGTGWAGPLGVPTGQTATIELRDKLRTSGTVGAVVGRVSLTAGSPTALVASGPPIQVKPGLLSTLPSTTETTITIPDASEAANLAMALRWGIPEALRRQVLLTRGFHVWRIDKTWSQPAGTLTAAVLDDPANTNNGMVTRITRNPAVASKLFRTAGSSESGPSVNDFVADNTTSFLVDDNQRYSGPGTLSSPFREGTTFDYVVAPVDLLGRAGPVSSRGSAIACATVPTETPDGDRVDNVVISDRQRLRVVWKWKAQPNSKPKTTHYLVFRDRAKNTAPPSSGPNPAANAIEDPTRHNQLIYIGTVAHPTTAPTGGVLIFDDPMLPNTDDYGRTYFYTIRAVHEGPPGCGYTVSSPCPALYGTFRDRVGPNAPTGLLVTQCPRVGVESQGPTASTPLNPNAPQGKVTLRLHAHREDSDVQWFQFKIQTARTSTQVVYQSEKLAFMTGDDLWIDVTTELSSSYAISTTAGLDSGRFSHPTYQDITSISPSTRITYSFTARSRSTQGMVPDDDTTADYWESFLPGPPQTFTATFGANTMYSGVWTGGTSSRDRELLVQFRRSGVWYNSVALLAANSTTFYFSGANGTAWRAWMITDPAGSTSFNDCQHDPNPAGETQIIPIFVQVTIPAGAREFRIYRRLDNGPLNLLKQEAGSYDAATAKTFMYEDAEQPPMGGVLSYFAQAFDDHSNPSPLALIGQKVGVEPELPQPVLSTVESVGNDVEPSLRIKVASPAPGVAKFQVRMIPAPENWNSLTEEVLSVTLSYVDGGLQPVPVDVVGEKNIPSNTPDQAAAMDELLLVKTGVEYSIQVRAVAPTGKEGPWCAEQKATWTGPISAGEVPWPARPLPKVVVWSELVKAQSIDNSAYIPVLTSSDQYFFFLQSLDNANLGAPPLVRNSELYPCGVRLGSLALEEIYPQSLRPTDPFAGVSNWDITKREQLFEGNKWAGYFAWRNVDDGSLPEVETLLAAKQEISGDIAYDNASMKLLPIVMYRQQVGWNLPNGRINVTDSDIVQVSPMIHRIETATATVDSNNYRSIVDPFVNVAMRRNTSQELIAADFFLFDTTPVSVNGIYHYYLAHFTNRGELDMIIDAGEAIIAP